MAHCVFFVLAGQGNYYIYYIMIVIKNFIFENFKGYRSFFFGFDFSGWGEIDPIFLVLN